MKNKPSIEKVAVIGSGIMGSRIACHMANIGLDVLLLDIAPFKLNDAEEMAKRSAILIGLICFGFMGAASWMLF